MISLFGAEIFAQDEVPMEVRTTFDILNPTVEEVFWEFREGAYVAAFQAPGGFTKAFFDQEGKWLETRIRVSMHLLPEKVTGFIDKHYWNADVTYVGKVLLPGGIKAYRIESELPSEIVIKILDGEGSLLDEQRISFTSLEETTPGLLPLPNKKVEPIIADEI